MFWTGMPELLIIVIVVMVLFGASRFPAIAKALGQSIREFKNARKEITNDIAGVAKDQEENKAG